MPSPSPPTSPLPPTSTVSPSKHPSTTSPTPRPPHPITQTEAEKSTSTLSIAATTPTPTVNTDADAAYARTQAQARRIAVLETKIAALKGELETNQTKEEEIRRGVKTPTPELTVQKHISLLHEYNRIRDIGTGLLGIIAENRGVRVRDLWEEFGIGEGD